jgi:hypothetical protein
MQRFQGVDNENIFLITLDGKEAQLYSEDRRDSKPVSFSNNEAEDARLKKMTICNAAVAYNGKFFIIGLVSEEESLIGVFAFQKSTWRSKPLKWINKVGHPLTLTKNCFSFYSPISMRMTTSQRSCS